MIKRESQKNEIETISERILTIELSDNDVERIQNKAGSVGMTVGELLSSFIGDLVNGTYSNGSDERMLARQWFERCGFSYGLNKSFLQYLCNNGEINYVLEPLDQIESCKEEIVELTLQLKNENYPWEKMMMRSHENPQGVRLYATKEEWQNDCRQQIEGTKDEILFQQEKIDEVWNQFLDWADHEHFDQETEIKKIDEWRIKSNMADSN